MKIFVVPAPAFGETETDVTTGTGIPVPLSATLCVDPATLLALSVTVSVALAGPVAAGLNVTAMVQFAPAGRLMPHPLASVKYVALVPVMAMPLIVSGPVPALLSVMF